jgi:hypothetical protein
MFPINRMRVLNKIGRDFSGYNILESSKRACGPQTAAMQPLRDRQL